MPPGVADADKDLVVLLPRLHGDLALVGEANGVGEQIHEYLANARRIEREERQRRLDLHRQLHGLAAQQPGDSVGRLSHDLPHVAHLLVQGQALHLHA